MTAGVLPPGLTLTADGGLSGTPTTLGVYSGIVVSADNGIAPAATQTFTITVTPDLRLYLPLAATVTPDLRLYLPLAATG